MATKPSAAKLIKAKAKQEDAELTEQVKAFEAEYKELCVKHGFIYVSQLASSPRAIAATLRIAKLTEEDIKAYHESKK